MSMDKWFYEQALLGKVHYGQNTTAGAVTVLSATCTGLVLENPFGSGKHLVVKRGSFTGSTLSTIREIGIQVSGNVQTVVSTVTTAAPQHNALLSGTNVDKGVGRTYSIATLGSTPVWLTSIGSPKVTAAVEATRSLIWEPNGDLIVTPGTYIAFGALTAAATGLCSFVWAEIDV
jgi:hypothetical protein